MASPSTSAPSPTKRARALLSGCFVFALAALALANRTPAAAAPAEATTTVPASARAEIVVIATPRDPHARESEVRFLAVDGSGVRASTVERVPHAVHAVVRGDVLPGRRAAAIACDKEGPRADDFGAALYVVDAARGLRELTTGLYHASRPLGSVDGSIYVERGTAGPMPTRFDPSHLREDALTIDAVDPDSGTMRAVYTWKGYTLHLAGELGSELIVYRVGPSGADITALERSSGRARRVCGVPPFARDFTVDPVKGSLVFSNRDETDAHLWTVESVDLGTGARRRLSATRDASEVPFLRRGGELVVTVPGRSGVSFLSGPAVSRRTLAPFGDGVDIVDAESPDGAWMLLSHRGAKGPELGLVHLRSGGAVRLTTGQENLRAVGFVGAANGGRR